MLLLDGKIASAAIKDSLKEEVAQIISTGKRPPHLAAILVGNNGASETYVASKVKNCAEIGFQSTLIRMDAGIAEEMLFAEIDRLNNDDSIDGILVQLPLPKQIDEQKVINRINPDKDVDGFHPVNVGKMVLGNPSFISATPFGILLMLQHYNISVSGKHVVIIGRSNIVGRPLSILFSSNAPYGNATVTLCHSRTKNLEALCREADVLVAALGIPQFVSVGMVKEGAVVIDVGITRVEDPSAKKGYRIRGDVNFDEVAPKTSAITPVPGGVGLMTIAGLLKNTLEAYRINNGNAEII